MDDVKVISKVLWNSSSEEIYGSSMTDNEPASLRDVFEVVDSDSTARASFILQFL